MKPTTIVAAIVQAGDGNVPEQLTTAMRFLADEHIPNSVVQALRDAGHEVVAAREVGKGAADPIHVALAAEQSLIILTEDEDFTARVREAAAAGRPLPPALIHYRLDGLGRATKPARMIDAIKEIGVIDTATVYSIEPTRIRSRKMTE